MSAQCGRRHWISGLVKAQSRPSSLWQSIVASRCSPAFSATFWLDRLSGRTRATITSSGISSSTLATMAEAAERFRERVAAGLEADDGLVADLLERRLDPYGAAAMLERQALASP